MRLRDPAFDHIHSVMRECSAQVDVRTDTSIDKSPRRIARCPLEKTCLVVGATRGLGASLARQYAESGWTVYGTARSSPKEYVVELLLYTHLIAPLSW